MNKYNDVVASLCGGTLVGEMIFPGGFIVGGLLGAWVSWPKSDVHTS
ncbi:hypothetical protein LCGC14_1001480 [marine sediment metagenome]|uniref:Uncharacterized protein n=1 Tax=marine sediment metagenome TaxID=412755 RepID=A0A0F9NPD1_9ZZZZ